MYMPSKYLITIMFTWTCISCLISSENYSLHNTKSDSSPCFGWKTRKPTHHVQLVMNECCEHECYTFSRILSSRLPETTTAESCFLMRNSPLFISTVLNQCLIKLIWQNILLALETNSYAPVNSRGASLMLTSLSYFPHRQYHFKAHLSLKADIKPHLTIIDFIVFYLNRV